MLAPLEPAKEASHSLLHMADVARKVCLAVGQQIKMARSNKDGGRRRAIKMARSKF